MVKEFCYIKKTYGVNPYIGQQITMDGKAGLVAEDRGNYVGVKFNENPDIIVSCHPTWKMKYIN